MAHGHVRFWSTVAKHCVPEMMGYSAIFLYLGGLGSLSNELVLVVYREGSSEVFVGEPRYDLALWNDCKTWVHVTSLINFVLSVEKATRL